MFRKSDKLFIGCWSNDLTDGVVTKTCLDREEAGLLSHVL